MNFKTNSRAYLNTKLVIIERKKLKVLKSANCEIGIEGKIHEN